MVTSHLLRHVRLLGCALAVVGLGLVIAVTVAVPVVMAAPPTTCPEAPAGYEGDDAVVRELRALRQDVAESCSAVRHRVVETRDEVADVATAVAGVEDAVKDTPEVGRVEVQEPVTVKLDDHERGRWLDSMSAAVTDLRTDAWGIGGALMGLALMLGFWRFVIR